MRRLVLILICFAVLVPGIASLPPTDRDESRYVQASRQMLETGDYLDIRLQDEPRYKKPVGIYWLQSAAATVSGYGEEAPLWVFRLVSFAGGLIAVLATAWCAARLFTPGAGFVAGAALAGTLALGFEARIAKTDAMLLAATVIAQAALAIVYLGGRKGQTPPAFAPWLFWLMQGLGILVKGPITPLASALTVAALVVFDRDRSWLRTLRAGWGIVLAAVIVLPWLVLITRESGWEFWQQSVGRDMLGKVASGQESHGFPPGYYVITYAVFLWPVAWLALEAGLNGLNRFRTDPRLRFLVCWYVPFWLLFELIPTKLPHYVLPAYPALAIMLGWFLTERESLTEPLRTWQVWLSRLALLGLILVTAALAAFPPGLTWYAASTIPLAAVLASITALAAGFLGSPLAKKVAVPVRIVAMTLFAGATYGLVTGVVLPSIRTIWISPRIAAAFETSRPCGDSVLAITRYHEPSVVFLTETATVLTGPGGAARHMKANPACAIAAVEARDEEAFRKALGPLSDSVRAVDAVGGVNYSNGEEIELTLYVVRQDTD